MDETIVCYIALNSPWSFMGGDRVHALASRCKVAVEVRPIDAGKVFPQSGGLPLPKRAPQRQAYRMIELKRWRKQLDIPLVLEPKHFPSPEADAAALVVAAGLEGMDDLALATAFGRALWVDDRNFSLREVRLEVLASLGMDAEHLESVAAGSAVAAKLAEFTGEAIKMGVFGMPTYFYRGEMFWGQDRVEFLERAVETATAA
jgi:2-hydroxychromene-2-carboxylate isomerase